jgi:FkbM family methyltransferase
MVMKQGIRFSIATKIHGTIKNIRYRFLPLRFLTPGETFYRAGGEDLLFRVQIPVEELILDFGGYLGEYSKRVRKKCPNPIYVFEPIPEYFSIMTKNLIELENVTLLNFAIGSRERVEIFRISGPATGAFVAGDEINVQFRSAGWLAQTIDRKIGLIKMNIEGGEYELIPALKEVGILNHSRILFIQFHNLPNNLYRESQAILEETHVRTWKYEWYWERWDLISQPIK